MDSGTKQPDPQIRGPRPVDRRWGERLRADLSVILFCKGEPSRAQLQDLSLSGGYVATRAEPAVGQHVVLEIDFPWQAARQLPPIAAVVVRQDLTGIGLEWLELGADPVLTLLTLLSQAQA